MRTASSSSAAGSAACTRPASSAGTRASSVTLVDRRNFHLFQPLLYQVATGALSPGEIAQPLRSILRRNANTTVLLGEAVGIDPERREVAPVRRRPDPLRHADRRDRAPATRTSATTSGPPIAPGLKTIEDATEIRRRILIAFEAAEREHDPERRRRVDDVRRRRRRPDRRRAGRRARRDRPRHAAPRLPLDPPARRPDHPRRGARPDPPDLPARPLARRPSASSSGSASMVRTQDPGRPHRRPRASGSTADGASEQHPDPDGPVGGRRPGVELRAGRRGGDRRRDGPGRPGRRRAGPDDPRPPRDLRRSATPPSSRGSRAARCRASPRAAIQGGSYAAAVDPAAAVGRARRRRSATATRATSRSSAGWPA